MHGYDQATETRTLLNVNGVLMIGAGVFALVSFVCFAIGKIADSGKPVDKPTDKIVITTPQVWYRTTSKGTYIIAKFDCPFEKGTVVIETGTDKVSVASVDSEVTTPAAEHHSDSHMLHGPHPDIWLLTDKPAAHLVYFRGCAVEDAAQKTTNESLRELALEVRSSIKLTLYSPERFYSEVMQGVKNED